MKHKRDIKSLHIYKWKATLNVHVGKQEYEKKLHGKIITCGNLVLRQNDSDTFSHQEMEYLKRLLSDGISTGDIWAQTLHEISKGNLDEEGKQ